MGFIVGGLGRAYADAIAQSKQEFCSNTYSNGRSINWKYFRELGFEKENLLSFTNYGGFADGGICWWHSRFTRNLLHLTVFRPELPRPSFAEALDIIRTLRSSSHIVEIPGYSTMQEFSKDYETTIEKVLENWQLFEGTFFGWLASLEGAKELPPRELELKMDGLYHSMLTDSKLHYQMMHQSEFGAHAWLVLGIAPTFKNGYQNGYSLTVLDSNSLAPETATYEFGESQISYDGHHFVPYTQREEDFGYYESAIRDYCHR